MIVVALTFFGLLAAPQADPVAPSIPADRYTNESYSFTAPDGWMLATRETLDELRREVGSGPLLENLDLANVDAFVFEAEGSMNVFASSINFVRSSAELSVAEDQLAELKQSLTQHLQERGVVFHQDMVVACTQVAGAACYQLDYQMTMPGQAEVVRQRQLLIPIGAQLLTVTLSALPDAFEGANAAFAELLGTLQVTPPTGLAATWRSLPRMLRSVILGGGIGVVFALVLGLSRRRRQMAEAS